MVCSGGLLWSGLVVWSGLVWPGLLVWSGLVVLSGLVWSGGQVWSGLLWFGGLVWSGLVCVLGRGSEALCLLSHLGSFYAFVSLRVGPSIWTPSMRRRTFGPNRYFFGGLAVYLAISLKASVGCRTVGHSTHFSCLLVGRSVSAPPFAVAL